MLTLKPVIKDYGGYLCRRCMDRRYGVHLACRDCIQTPDPRECPCCRNYTNLVMGLKLTGKTKWWGSRDTRHKPCENRGRDTVGGKP